MMLFLESRCLFSVIGCVPLCTVDVCEGNTHLFKEKTEKIKMSRQNDVVFTCCRCRCRHITEYFIACAQMPVCERLSGRVLASACILEFISCHNIARHLKEVHKIPHESTFVVLSAQSLKI